MPFIEQLFPKELIRVKGGYIKTWEQGIGEGGVYSYKIFIQALQYLMQKIYASLLKLSLIFMGFDPAINNIL